MPEPARGEVARDLEVGGVVQRGPGFAAVGGAPGGALVLDGGAAEGRDALMFELLVARIRRRQIRTAEGELQVLKDSLKVKEEELANEEKKARNLAKRKKAEERKRAAFQVRPHEASLS